MIRQCPACGHWLRGAAAFFMPRCVFCYAPKPSAIPTDQDIIDVQHLDDPEWAIEVDVLRGMWDELDRAAPPPHEPPATERTRP